MAWWNPFKREQKYLQSVDDRGWSRIFDWTPHAWQTHDPYDTEESVLAYPAVFACTTLIEGDIGKIPFIVQQKNEKVWESVDHDILKLLRRPNKYQNHIQFKRNWMNSKLVHGNTYVLKVREGREVVGLIILDPLRVQPLVSDMGEVFYRLSDDQLADIDEQLTVPSTEIIHDRFNCLYHPLVGLSPLFACTVSGKMGLSIVNNSQSFFKNGANPSGILTAPGAISDDTAKRLKDEFESKFSGKKSGRVAVAGDGLKYEPMRMTNVDAQLIEHAKWSAEMICSVYHVPAYMVGVGAPPSYNNIENLAIQYHNQCLGSLIEEMEESLNQGLNLQSRFRIQLDHNVLFRMDQATQTKMLNDAIGGGWMAPNEARQKVNLMPVEGGDSPYMQQQNYSLEALAQRDSENPLGKPPEPEPESEPDISEMAMSAIVERRARKIIDGVAA